MLMLALAAATIMVDPTAAAAIETCVAQAQATHKACDTNWRTIRLRLDETLKGSLRVSEDGHGASWTSDCPYDVIRRSGGCALIAKGVLFIQPYRSDIPGISWGDRNAERRERLIRFDGERTATWSRAMSIEDTREVLAMLERSKRATFGWRAARAKTMSATTLDLTGFSDLRILLTAMTRAAAKQHAGG